MAWIKSNEEIGQHPKTYALATALNGDIPTAVGVLHLLWHFALKFAWRTGDLKKYPPDAIAQAIGWRGDPTLLINALQKTGWLDRMRVHDWLDYAGKIVDDRLYNEKRRKTATNGVTFRKSTARVEKSRVEEINTPLPPKGAFDLIWVKYPNKDGKDAAQRHFKHTVKTMTDWLDIQRALDNYLRSERVSKGFIKNGSTWFNNWRDWINYTEAKNGTHDSASHTSLAAAAERAREIRRSQGLRKVSETTAGSILAGIRSHEVDPAPVARSEHRESVRE